MAYRNHELLGLARLAPHCMGCERRNEGQVVSAHSNASSDGKGLGLKASDACVAFLCDKCHFEVDQGPASWTEKRVAWFNAYVKTMRWLIETGHLVVSLVPQPPPTPPDKPKRAMAKGRKLQGASFPNSDIKKAWPKRPFPKRS